MTASRTGAPGLGSVDRSATRENVEAILPLLPLQDALLFHGDTAGQDDPGLLQVRATLEGDLDQDLMRKAWEAVVGWHPSLRVSLHSTSGKDPMSVIWKNVDTPWAYRDISDAIDPDSAVDELLASDRDRGLDLARPPSMRLMVVRTGDGTHELIWTCHHLFLDGWSSAIVLEDVLLVYRSLRRGEVAPPVPHDPLRQAYSAIADSEHKHLETWWRQRLAGYEGPPPLPSPVTPEATKREIELASGTSSALRATAGRHGVTVNAIVQAAWALTLAAMQGDSDVVFGTTVSGRSLDLIGIDRVVGFVANVVPIRARLDRSAAATDLMAELRDAQFEMRPYEHASPAAIQSWSDVPGHLPLFRTFLVVENFPVNGAAAGDDLVMTAFRSGLTTAYPVTVAAIIGDPWLIHVEGSSLVDGRWIERASRNIATVLEALADDPTRTVGNLLDAIPPVDLRRQTKPMSRDHQTTLPRTATEHRLLSVWERLLGMETIGVDDDYFDLGGTSILALRLFSEIEAEFDSRLPLRTLLAAPTVSKLARAIDGENPALQWESLVPIETDGETGHVFCVHSGGGNALTYRDLARALPGRPVYGLTALGLDGRHTPFETVPDMARHYIAEMEDVQPAGPYRLVGHCFGGSVCLEIAAQLEDAGEEVELVTVIDAALPLRAARSTSLLGRAARVLRARGVSGLVQTVLSRIRPRQAGRMWDGSVADENGADSRRRVVAQANQRAFARFEPRRISAPVLLVQSSTEIRTGEGVYWHQDWSQFTDDFIIEQIEADHQELLRRPDVAMVADAIRDRLGD